MDQPPNEPSRVANLDGMISLGVVLGVTQVALGLQLMLGGMSGLIAQGVFTAPGN
jgi:hypothetical protein